MALLKSWIFLFISFHCLSHLCTAAAYGENCQQTSECSGDYQQCLNSSCLCSSGYTVNGDQSGCNAVTWSTWSQWGNCDVTCGSGSRTRTRTCPVANSCTPGLDTETESCVNGVCPVDGNWGPWSQWSACSPTCGDSSGTQTRSRNCNNPSPSNGGNDCAGDSRETRSCTINACPVNGGFTEWSQWSTCTVTCVGGTQRRTRSCTNPKPQNGGAPCSGDISMSQNCNSQACPEVEFGQPCTTNGDKCKGDNTGCISGFCRCTSGYYRNGNACVPKIELGATGCSVSVQDSCMSPYATCQSNGGSCICDSGYYDSNGGETGGTCTRKIELGSYGCSRTVSDSCMSAHATCQSNGYCRCYNGYYDDNGSQGGGTCMEKIELGSPGCSRTVSDSCMSPYATCQSNGYCTCNNGYYDNNGGQSGGTCTRKIELGSPGCSRTVSDSCMSPYATCQSNGYCTCNNGYYDNNGGRSDGTCTRKIELGSSGCSRDVSDSCMSAHATCQSNGGYCLCDNGYYDNNGGESGGTCAQQKALGAQCSNLQSECADTYASCLDNTCTCRSGYYDNNGFVAGGSCENVSGLKVTSITFQLVTTYGFRVSWTPPSGGKASHINRYEIEWSLKSSDNSLAGGNSVVSGGITVLDVNTGVTAGKTYIIKVISVNTNTRKDDTRTTFLSKEQASKPNKPRLLTTSDLDARDERITVGWSAPSSGVTIGYRVQLYDGTTPLTNQDFTQKTATIYYQNMKNGHRYDVKISAKSELYEGSGYELSDMYEEQITTTVQVPTAPRNVKCDVLKDESITLKWLKPSVPNGDLVRYIIQVFSANGTLLFSTSTTGVIETHQVIQLSPGTTYMFKVYTENVMYNSSNSAISSYCTTKAKLSDPPNDFQTTEVTSRNISIKWTEPIQSYSEEIYGYVIQLKRGDTCKAEIVYKCLTPSCRATFEPSSLENMCSNNVRNVVSLVKSQLIGPKSYQFLDLLPDTIYTIIGAAVTNLGSGNTAALAISTEEEAPQKPYNVLVSEIMATSFKVTWNIVDPRPGKTNFTVKLMAESPADSKEFIIKGFNSRTYIADNLEEYWYYSVFVTITTSKGSRTSAETGKYRTLPAAPGRISNFVITTNPGGNYTRMKIIWQAPEILLQNSLIKSYSFIFFQDQKLENLQVKSFDHQLSQSYNYEIFVSVIPEESYAFEVFAINDRNMTGEKYTERRTAPAGVPLNIATKLNAKVIALSNTVENREKTKITVIIMQDFFEEITYGKIRASGIIACVKFCALSGIKTVTEFDNMRNWRQAVGSGLSQYRITSPSWFDIHRSKKDDDRAVTYMDYTIGTDSCNNISPGEYCNGPLMPGTEYIFVAVTCTNGGCLLSKEYGPFFTAGEISADEDGSQTTTVIVGVVLSALIIVLALYAIYATLVIRRYRKNEDENEINQIPKRKGPVYANTSFMMGIAEMNLGSNEATTASSDTEYSRLDENTRDDMETYQRIEVSQNMF